LKLSDLKGVFNKHDLFVVSIHKQSNGYYTVKLDASGIQWRPGEHGIFSLPDRSFSGRKWRAFSIASIPNENEMLLGTSIGIKPSGFKQVLASLEKGDIIRLRGPFGWFVLQDDATPIVMIAGGIGITPVRALLKSVEKTQNRNIHVVHSSKGGHLFGDELVKLSNQNNKIDLHLTNDRAMTQAIIADLVFEYGNKAFYYISGPPKMIKDYRKILKSKSIKNKRIVTDPFVGY